ncbi:MAG: hypothetical protein JWQ78_1016, partial [Sediminibacterium sp.]|nr:hypothetical protein [Sediminibacterium sp.]
TATYIRQELGLDIPIMAMTATALKGDQEKCRQVGMNDFMLKPFDFNDLYKRLGNLLFPGVAGADEVAEKKEEREKLYDLALLEELDDRESLLDVITLFLDSTPPEMTALPALVAEKNWKGLYRQAHKIKGAVAILQSTAIASLLGKIEANAKEEKDLAQTAAYVDEAVVLFAAMEKRLREEQQQIQKELASTK